MQSNSLKSKTFTFIFKNFKDLRLLLFWPLFGLAFLFLERGSDRNWFVVECALDNIIPFCEFFVIPYLFWFLYIIFMNFYSFFYDRPTFVKYMKFTIITYTITTIIYVLFPTAQELRPNIIALNRENIFTNFLMHFYQFDTNTNVCPSLHVSGGIAVWAAGWNSKHFSSAIWRIVSTVVLLLICASTVFLKQHSILDVFFAVLICAATYFIVFVKKQKNQK